MSTALVKRPHGRIYMVRNTGNGKIYIGQTVHSVEHRWRKHCSTARRKRGHFPCALVKHGIESFRISPVFSASDQDELNVLEILYIALRKSADPRIGYNLALGGGAGRPSDASRERMCAAQKLRFQTETDSEGTREKRSAATKRWLSENPHPMLGKKMSAESIEKTAVKNRGRRNHKNAVLLKIRMQNLTPEQKRAIALKGASSRWGKTYQ